MTSKRKSVPALECTETQKLLSSSSQCHNWQMRCHAATSNIMPLSMFMYTYFDYKFNSNSKLSTCAIK